MDNVERAERFKQARLELNLNGKEGRQKVSEQAGVPLSAIAAYENPVSTRALNKEHVERLAEHYWVNDAWLLGMSECWSRDKDTLKINEMTGLSAEAIRVLQLLMMDEDKRKFINDFLSSETFKEMVYAVSRIRKEKLERESAVSENDCEENLFDEDEFDDWDYFAEMRIKRICRKLEQIMNNWSLLYNYGSVKSFL